MSIKVLYIYILETCVRAHNKLRRLHVDTPDLKWDIKLAAKAQKYAELLVAENKKSSQFFFKHSTDRVNIGENLAWQNSRQKQTCAGATHAW